MPTLPASCCSISRGQRAGCAQVLLEQATESFRLSMRGYTRVLRVARTIADLEGSQTVEKHHIAEAVSFRQAPLMQNAKVA